MTALIEHSRWRHVANPRVTPGAPIGERQRAILHQAALEQARDEIRRWPGYAATPLVGLDGLAAAAGVAAIHYKDESERFSLKSFKALGGAYAVLRLIKRRLGEQVTSEALMAGEYRDALDGLTVCCATDGNHGRSVAWGARQFGVRCVIYLHATVSPGREQAIADFGAEIRRVAGNYDDSVRQAASDAAEYGWFVVSDTSYPGYMEVPRDVMQGYSVMVDEAVDQLDQPPTHCFVQGGVGGLAAATLAQLWEAYGVNRPRVIVVEPERAACLLESARSGEPVAVDGDLDTLMAGLACGEVSLLAWEVLDEGIDDYLAVSDEAAVEAMKLLAEGVGGDPALVAGESAVAGLVGLLLASQEPDLGARLGLDGNSRVLLIGSEGATDAEVYRELVGASAEDVIARGRANHVE
ncbi:diaminopropionate ammonia-lyase [Halomonas litopenaei]|uniref:Diaminopropionate ammonia-lyase n=1 Tax=Halomonas litopenaei TaxID=2109328 RepID=A0ABX5J0N7_9GAMM|nr:MULTISPECIES: diaminopropionate ammonia-lyase [Halomonas]MBY6110874.1 diaminopropionate ammonia-lyase [Halomonas sp. DP1Y21-3]PTL91335.1 diaminopropionate ammonia-lyase [Halomonas sp. SYSU XM8]PTL95189.1 diaminopropionate ammonia-lyase [Halomonas litopenaei]